METWPMTKQQQCCSLISGQPAGVQALQQVPALHRMSQGLLALLLVAATHPCSFSRAACCSRLAATTACSLRCAASLLLLHTHS
jgi:hypothetical protein